MHTCTHVALQLNPFGSVRYIFQRKHNAFHFTMHTHNATQFGSLCVCVRVRARALMHTWSETGKHIPRVPNQMRQRMRGHSHNVPGESSSSRTYLCVASCVCVCVSVFEINAHPRARARLRESHRGKPDQLYSTAHARACVVSNATATARRAHTNSARSREYLHCGMAFLISNRTRMMMQMFFS